MNEGIIVACISVIGVVLGALIQTFRKENHADHAQVMHAVQRIETKIDGHISDHARGDL
jgi:uncharacterized membrane-anchored protein YhcB (DUF1043 family)